ncbi:MAG: response regulator transcription factor [Phycisphaerae bacterium]|nr:response regulator transcription factor [Phycisphaerae bacterium]
MNEHRARIIPRPRSADDITVLCVDDSPELIMMLTALIDKERGLAVIGSVFDAASFVQAAARLKPRVAVVDLSMPGDLTPLEGIRRAAEEAPQTRVIAYSGYDDLLTRDQAMDAGAWGFVSKNGELRAIVEAVRRVAAGDAVF